MPPLPHFSSYLFAHSSYMTLKNIFPFYLYINPVSYVVLLLLFYYYLSFPGDRY